MVLIQIRDVPEPVRDLSPYDAAYVALAEMTGNVLVTGDERITGSPGIRCATQIVK